MLIASETEERCKTDTSYVLKCLANKGHKASKAKLQFVKQRVQYLEHLLLGDGRQLTPERISSFFHSSPFHQSQVYKFLGTAGYCRQWIPNFSGLTRPLTILLLILAPDPVTWSPECESAFLSLKTLLHSGLT